MVSRIETAITIAARKFMNTLVLNAEPLTKENFAPYGDVIETEGAEHYGINLDTVERYHDLAKVQADYSNNGRPIISLAKIKIASSYPFNFNLVERHPRGSQAFIPMFQAPVTLVVAKPGNSPKTSDLKAFVSNGQQGFNYHAGVWHMPLMSDVAGRMFVVVDRSGPGNNCDEFTFKNENVELKI